MEKKNIKEVIDAVYYTFSFEERDSFKNGIRVKPFIKIKLKDSDMVDRVKFELLEYGISSSRYPDGVFITSISSCNLALKFLDPPVWWRKAFEMVKDGKHTTKEGILKILQRRNKECKNGEGMNRVWTKEKAIRVMSEANSE